MDEMYDLLDDINSAINHLQDARDDLKHFPDERCGVGEMLMLLIERKFEIEKKISESESKERAALEREYYKNLL